MIAPSAITPELAEVIGVHLGDECLSSRVNGTSESNIVAFTGHRSEYWYYESFIKPTVERTFGVKGRLFLRESDNTTRYVISNRSLVSFLASLGLPIGKKFDAWIPRAIFDQGQTVPCVRGIYHAEGSFYRRYSKPYNTMVKTYNNLLVIQIRMKLRTLMNQIHDELLNLGIRCNRLTEKYGVYTQRITDQEEITKFLKAVNPKLKSHPPPIKL